MPTINVREVVPKTSQENYFWHQPLNDGLSMAVDARDDAIVIYQTETGYAVARLNLESQDKLRKMIADNV